MPRQQCSQTDGSEQVSSPSLGVHGFGGRGDGVGGGGVDIYYFLLFILWCTFNESVNDITHLSIT